MFLWRKPEISEQALKSDFNASAWFACICHACKFANLQLNSIITRISKRFYQHRVLCLRFRRRNAAKLFVDTPTAVKSIETNEGPAGRKTFNFIDWISFNSDGFESIMTLRMAKPTSVHVINSLNYLLILSVMFPFRRAFCSHGTQRDIHIPRAFVLLAHTVDRMYVICHARGWNNKSLLLINRFSPPVDNSRRLKNHVP